MNVNDRVRALINLDEWTDAHGSSRCASKGEILVIREMPYSDVFLVSHPERTDGMTFRVNSHEVEPE